MVAELRRKRNFNATRPVRFNSPAPSVSRFTPGRIFCCLERSTCSVKRFDPLIRLATVYNVLSELVQCGLASTINPERHREPRRYQLAAQPNEAQHAVIRIWSARTATQGSQGRNENLCRLFAVFTLLRS